LRPSRGRYHFGMKLALYAANRMFTLMITVERGHVCPPHRNMPCRAQRISSRKGA
jgi:hypothetical protein